MCSFLGVSFFIDVPLSVVCLHLVLINQYVTHTYLAFGFSFLLLTNVDLTSNLMSNCCTFPSRSSFSIPVPRSLLYYMQHYFLFSDTLIS